MNIDEIEAEVLKLDPIFRLPVLAAFCWQSANTNVDPGIRVALPTLPVGFLRTGGP